MAAVKPGQGVVGQIESDAAVFRVPGVIGDALAQKLAEQIIFLNLPPGTHITEDDLCNEYVVSRSPVREAFRALEADGLVLRLARRGVRVAPISRKDLDEVYACRIVLEGLAAREAAEHATDEDLATMRKLLDAMAKALKRGQVRAFFDANVAFTGAVHLASANRTLIRIADGIEKQALRYRYLAHSRTRKMLEVSLDGQGRVFDMIAKHKPGLAEQQGKATIRHAQAVIQEVIDALSPEEAGHEPPRRIVRMR